MLKRLDLSIGALAERSGCNVPTIRYYEAIGLLPKANRDPGGRRIYANDDQRRLTFVRRCRDFGFSIEKVRALVRLTQAIGGDCVDARDMAQAQVKIVRLKLTELHALEATLIGLVDQCDASCAGGPSADCVIFDKLTDTKSSSCCG